MRHRLLPGLLLAVVLYMAQSACCEPLLLPILLQASRMADLSKHIETHGSGTTIRQTSEITCGPAALATLLNFYFGESTYEDELARLSSTYEQGTTTLLGLCEACTTKGYKATGYRMSLSQLLNKLKASQVPVLVHFSKPGLHYVLAVAEIDGFLLISDPSLGDVTITKSDFARRWSGVALVVSSPEKQPDRSRAQGRERSAGIRLAALRASSTAALRRGGTW